MVQLLSCVWVFAIPRTAAQQTSLFITIKTNQHTKSQKESTEWSRKKLFSSAKSLSHVLLLAIPMDCSTPGFPVHHQLSKLAHHPCPLSWWYHPTISSSVIPFSSGHQSFPGSGSFPVSWFFASSGQNTGALASASVLSKKYSETISQDRLVWSPCSQRDSQESSTPHFKNINSLVLSLPYGPTLTSVHDYFKNQLILDLYGPLSAK